MAGKTETALLMERIETKREAMHHNWFTLATERISGQERDALMAEQKALGDELSALLRRAWELEDDEPA